jgi:hypothetical protein
MSARSKIWPLAALLGGLALSACGSSTKVKPVRGTVADAGPDASGDASPPAEAGEAEAGPPVRTIETRPRFGALDPTNMLLDGDFEYSGMDAEQYPWFGLDYTWVVTGSACRHGLRCARVPAGQYNYIAGVFVWPDAPSVDIEFFAKPGGSGNCTDDVSGVLIPLSDYAGEPLYQIPVMPSSPTPEADGWCDVKTTVQVPSDTGNTFWALVIGPNRGSQDSILVDDASLRASVSTSGGSSMRALARDPHLDALAARARADFAKRPPFPPRAEPTPVKNRTARRLIVR